MQRFQPFSIREILHKDVIANSMNNYFCSIGKDLANEIPDTPNFLVPLYGFLPVKEH